MIVTQDYTSTTTQSTETCTQYTGETYLDFR